MPSSGPNNASTAASVAFSGSGSAWSSVNNCLTDGSDYALTSTGGQAEYLKVTGFGFSIPSGSTIDGIVAEYKMYEPSAGDGRVRIVKGGTIGSTDRSVGGGYSAAFPPSTYFSRGGVSDLWGETWTVADINDSGFGFAVAPVQGGGAGNPCCFHVRMTVYYTVASVADVFLPAFVW